MNCCHIKINENRNALTWDILKVLCRVCSAANSLHSLLKFWYGIYSNENDFVTTSCRKLEQETGILCINSTGTSSRQIVFVGGQGVAFKLTKQQKKINDIVVVTIGFYSFLYKVSDWFNKGRSKYANTLFNFFRHLFEHHNQKV